MGLELFAHEVHLDDKILVPLVINLHICHHVQALRVDRRPKTKLYVDHSSTKTILLLLLMHTRLSDDDLWVVVTIISGPDVDSSANSEVAVQD